MDPGGLIFAGLALAAYIAFHLLRRWRETVRRRQSRKDSAEFMRKAAEGKPPMTAADAEALERWLADNTLPYVTLALADAPPTNPQATSLGGPAWLPQDMPWPTSQAGLPMIFLARINFADMPKLPDFPDRGLLLFFLGPDDLFGADFGDPSRGDTRLVWIPDPSIAGRTTSRPGPHVDDSPFQDAEVEQRGRAATFTTGSMPPRPGDWRIEKQWPAWWARGGDERFHDILDTDKEEWGPNIHVGGHPRFTQTDIREDAANLAGHDRVLLQVGTSNAIMWGDAGEAVFLIRHEDLLARDFARAIFTWDCH